MTTLAAAVPEPFTVAQGSIALALPGGEVRFTTRTGPDLRSWQEDDTRAALARIAGVAPEAVAQAHQVHEARVSVTAEGGPPDEDADGQATARPGVCCVVRTADCVPVALVAPEAVAMLHGGWRGLAAGILEAGTAALRGLGASDIRAAIGPSARVCCYEAGPEVHAAFAALGPVARRGDHADLPAIARALLEREGIGEIHDTGLCTICHPELLWSHRREGEAAGRQGGLAWRS